MQIINSNIKLLLIRKRANHEASDCDSTSNRTKFTENKFPKSTLNLKINKKRLLQC